MKTKTIFITGAEGTGSGMWNWYPNKINADKSHAENVLNLNSIDGEIVYRGELNVPEHFVKDEITAYVENYLHEHGFELASLNNKIIEPKNLNQ